MAAQTTNNIVLSCPTIKEKEGVVIFDLGKYRLIEKELGEYRRKTALLKSLKTFEELTKWGRSFAKKRGISQKQVLEND